MSRLEEVKRDVNAPSVVFQRLTEGEELPQIAKAWGCPKGRFVEWFTTEHSDLYDAALKVRAADLALEALEDANAATAEDTGPRKLQVDTKKWFAARYDRQRFGERAQVQVQVEDKRVPLDRDALILETGRRVAFMLHSAARAAAERGARPLLPAPEREVGPSAEPQQEKNDRDVGII